mgnify:CR=1 FL=1
MPTWAAIIVAICGCTGGFNIVALILQRRWSKQDKKDERLDAIEKSLEELKGAQRASMEERIRYLVGHFLGKGEISMAELSNLREMHKKYVGVGGNGNLDTEMELLDTIPVKG